MSLKMSWRASERLVWKGRKGEDENKVKKGTLGETGGRVGSVREGETYISSTWQITPKLTYEEMASRLHLISDHENHEESPIRTMYEARASLIPPGGQNSCRTLRPKAYCLIFPEESGTNSLV